MQRRIKHSLEYAGVVFLGLLARAVPLRAARFLGRALGSLAFRVVRIRREVTLANLQRAFPEKDAQVRLAIAEATYRHFGMLVVEMLRVPGLRERRIQKLISSDGSETLVNTALEEGSGAILLTGHFGNWEYLGFWLAARGVPITYMFQEQSNPHVSALIRRSRERMGMDMVSRSGSGLRTYLKALRRNRFVAMLADQDAGAGGLFLNFFGTPASTAVGPAKFHLKTGAPMIFSTCWRDARHDLHVEFERIDPAVHSEDNDAAAGEVMQAYLQTLERWVRRHPEQWFWMHRRWKSRPSAQPALDPVS